MQNAEQGTQNGEVPVAAFAVTEAPSPWPWPDEMAGDWEVWDVWLDMVLDCGTRVLSPRPPAFRAASQTTCYGGRGLGRGGNSSDFFLAPSPWPSPPQDQSDFGQRPGAGRGDNHIGGESFFHATNVFNSPEWGRGGRSRLSAVTAIRLDSTTNVLRLRSFRDICN
jgi:hypothetical protein